MQDMPRILSFFAAFCIAFQETALRFFEGQWYEEDGALVLQLFGGALYETEEHYDFYGNGAVKKVPQIFNGVPLRRDPPSKFGCFFTAPERFKELLIMSSRGRSDAAISD